MELLLLGEGTTAPPSSERQVAPDQETIRSTSIQPDEANDQVAFLKTGNGGQPLICFHPGGGQLDIYNDLVEILPPHLSVIGIKSPPEMTFDSIESMAEAYLPLVRKVSSKGGFRLFGFSLGGFLALSTASLLESQGEEVSFLGVVDAKISAGSGQRQTYLENAITEISRELNRFLKLDQSNSENRLEAEVRALAGELLSLSQDALLERIFEWVDKTFLDRVPVRSDELKEYLALLIHHVILSSDYEPKEVKSPLFTWTSSIRSLGKDDTDWQQMTTAKHVGRQFEVAHFDLMRPPVVEEIAHQMVHELDD